MKFVAIIISVPKFKCIEKLLQYFPPQAGSPHVSQPLFTYDTLRQRDPYTRLDSDASSLGPSLSPSHQVHVPRVYRQSDSN